MIKKYKNIILKIIKKYMYILLILILIIVISGITFFIKNKNTKVIKINDSLESEMPQISEIDNKKTDVKEIENNKVKYADIKGKVASPGIYEIFDNERVSDLIEKAGGLVEGANTSYINLSKKLKDEMVVIIYSDKEVLEYKENMNSNYSDITVECICPDKSNDACIVDEKIENGIVDGNSKSEKEENKDATSDNTNEESVKQKISINTASLVELMEIPGIGEAKAKSIIAYRTDEKTFTKIEDIKNVSGIGDSLFEKIKDHITV